MAEQETKEWPVKMLFFDTETTGLDPVKNSLFQIALIVEIDEQIKFRKSYYARPLAGTIASPEALKINKVTVEQLRDMPPAEETFKKIRDDISPFLNGSRFDKFILSGYNSGPFDIPFFKTWVEKIAGFTEYNKMFWVGGVDVMDFALWKLRKTRGNMVNFKQETVARELGIKVDENLSHEGMYDVCTCYNIFRAIFKKPLVDFSAEQGNAPQNTP